MLIQISSGQGPIECERAVYLFADKLMSEIPSCEIMSKHSSRYAEQDCYNSILLSTDSDIPDIEGTIQWIAQSPFRPHHKRKNWYIDVSVIPELSDIQIPKKEDMIFERFHSGGKGGQNVNKVETGVRLIHKPTSIAVTCTEERSQYQNRRKAEEKLKSLLALKDFENKRKQNDEAWRKHYALERGNPVRVYEGAKFKRLR